MKKLVLATHGDMAKGLKSSLEIIHGSVEDIIAINAFTDDCPNLEAVVDELLEQYSDEDLVVLTDIFFGGVNQVFMRAKAKKHRNFPLLTGVNLPMAMELACMIGESVEDELEEIERMSRECIQIVKLEKLISGSSDEEEDL